MTTSDPRTLALLTQARRHRPPPQAKGDVRQKLAESVALSAATCALLSVKAAPLATAKLASAFKAGCAVTPGFTSSATVSTPLLLLAPITVGIALGLSAMTPSSPEPGHSRAVEPRAIVQARRTPSKTVVAPQPVTAPVVEAPTISATPVTPTAPAPALPPTSLNRQSELLEHARLVLRQGDPTLALRSLETYRREFPKGAFFFEALTLQATALCQLGRLTEGRTLLARLEASGAPASTLNLPRSLCRIEPLP